MSATSFEDVLLHVGEFGRWQWGIFALFVLIRLVYDYQFSGYIYNCSLPTFSCNVTSIFSPDNWTSTQIKDFMLPRVDYDGLETWSQCEYYARNYSQFINMTYEEASNTTDWELETMSCTSWEYDGGGYDQSTVSEWNLVCDRTSLRPSLQSMYMFGALCGSFLTGIISDRLGRKKALIVAFLVMTISTWGEVYAPNYLTYLTFRFFTGFGAIGIYTATQVHIVEVVGKSKRAVASFSLGLTQSVVRIVIAGIAFLIPNWRDFTLSAACTSTILLVLLCWLLPESPRWLLMKKRYKEAYKIMRQISKTNKTNWPEEEVKQLMFSIQEKEDVDKGQEETANKHGKCEHLMSLVRSSEICSRCLKLWATYFIIALVSHGSLYLAARIRIDIHLMMSFSGLMGIIAIGAAVPIINRCGRKYVFATSLFTAAPLVSAVAIFPSDPVWISWLFIQVSKMPIAISYSVGQLLSTELFPTDTRTVAVASVMVISRVAAILAPYSVDMTGSYSVVVPSLLYGILSIVAGVIALFMPETKKVNLPDKVVDIRKSSQQRSNGTSFPDKKDGLHDPE